MYHAYVCAMCIMCVCYLCVYNVCLQVHVLQLYVCAVYPYTSNSSCIVFAPSPFITCNLSPTKCYLHHRYQFVMYHLCSRVFAYIISVSYFAPSLTLSPSSELVYICRLRDQLGDINKLRDYQDRAQGAREDRLANRLLERRGKKMLETG